MSVDIFSQPPPPLPTLDFFPLFPSLLYSPLPQHCERKTSLLHLQHLFTSRLLTERLRTFTCSKPLVIWPALAWVPVSLKRLTAWIRTVVGGLHLPHVHPCLWLWARSTLLLCCITQHDGPLLSMEGHAGGRHVKDGNPWCVCFLLAYWTSSAWKRLNPTLVGSFYSALLMLQALTCSGEWAWANGRAIFTTQILFV